MEEFKLNAMDILHTFPDSPARNSLRDLVAFTVSRNKYMSIGYFFAGRCSVEALAFFDPISLATSSCDTDLILSRDLNFLNNFSIVLDPIPGISSRADRVMVPDRFCL